MWHPDIPAEYRNSIVTGDARELARALPDESIDLIFTDPPYPREYLPLYAWLAETAARVLKPGGLCIALSGNSYFDEVMRQMTTHLDYYWIGGMRNPSASQVNRVHPRQMLCQWKPALWLTKGVPNKHAYVFDMFDNPMDKRFHTWGQAALWVSYYIGKLTTSDSIVWEPFSGGGTVPAVCKMLSRNYIAFEIDPATAERARIRVEATQAMHPVFLEEQQVLL